MIENLIFIKRRMTYQFSSGQGISVRKNQIVPCELEISWGKVFTKLTRSSAHAGRKRHMWIPMAM